VRGIAMVGNKSGKRISNCTPTIGRYPRKRPPSKAAVTFLRETDG